MYIFVIFILAGERELPNYYNLRKSKLLTLGTLTNGCPPFDELDTHDLYGIVECSVITYGHS